MDLTKLFSPDYLFSVFPGVDFAYRLPTYGFFVLLVVAGLLLPRILRKRPQAKVEHLFFGGIPYRLVEFGVAGLLLTFFRDQNVPYFGMRIWMLLLLIGLLVYLVWIWRNYKKNFAAQLVAKQSKKAEDKYKPKSKTKATKKRK